MVSLRTITGRSSKKNGRNTTKKLTRPTIKPRLFTWQSMSMAMLVIIIIDQGVAKAAARSSLAIREGPNHLHDNLLAHSVAMEDINSELEFASVRHMYASHPNSVVHASRQEPKNLARATEGAASTYGTMGIDNVQRPKENFVAGFTGVALRVGASFLSFIGNYICQYLTDAFGDMPSNGQIAGIAACYLGVNLLGIFGLFSAGHNLYKIQQAGTRAQEILDTTNRVFQLTDIAVGSSKRELTSVHELLQNELHTHRLAVTLADMGHAYEAVGLMSTIRPVALKNGVNGTHTSHLWQELREGRITKTHVLTRPNHSGQVLKRQQVCDDSDDQQGQDPEEQLCSSGDEEGFTGVYDSFDMFQSESDFESVQYGFGDSYYAQDVAKYAGYLQELGGNKSEVCMYPSVNNVTALTILSSMEFGGKPSQTYSDCPSLSS